MKKIFVSIIVIIFLTVISYINSRSPVITLEQSDEFNISASKLQTNLITKGNKGDLLVTVDGAKLDEYDYYFYYGDKFQLMASQSFYKEILSCALNEYADGRVLLERGTASILMNLDSNIATVNGIEIDLLDKVTKNEEDKTLYIPINEISKYLNCSVSYYLENNHIDIARVGVDSKLPAVYDMRDVGRVTDVRDQGRYGTCWAFASLAAIESSLMPYKEYTFSPDHMTLSNSYKLGVDMGGEHTMSIAYLAGWQGPVLEKDDPYGDAVSDNSLDSVVHLEEAILIEDRDLEIIKSAIYRYGAVETSLYTQMEYRDSFSYYYNKDTAAYCYIGDAIPNHDVIVVGWDDNYDKENFSIQPEANGAFICKNSWGTEFGKDGYFYVSYYDSNICNIAVVYSRVGDKDNYDNIYQSDMLGWIGQMGFGKDTAFFANAYTAGEEEELAAVSFYATGPGTKFDVYVVPEFTDESSFKQREFVVSGETRYAGYYTVDFPESIRLQDNKKFAVMVKITTPDAIHPIAIEYNADERTETFDISDGEGYISLYGELWHNAETTQESNVCLKAFTNKISSQED